MPKRSDQATEELLRDSEALLGHIEEADRLVADLPDQTVADINSKLRRDELESLNRDSNPQTDARVEVHSSLDDMLSTADFFPPVAGGRPLEMEDVERNLAARNVGYGIMWDVIRDAIYRCNTDGVELDSVIIAEGKRPVPETAEHIVINRRLLEPATPKEVDGESLESEDRCTVVLVEQGELLAKRVAKQEGQSGWTVFAKELPAGKKETPQTEAGKNTREDADGIFASCRGRFILEGRTFYVRPVLEIAGDVDNSTGHLDFDGDIIIRGDVLDGFNIKATGSVQCERTLSASQVECGGDLIVGRGIVGRQSGEVRASGQVCCKYIEHCYVEAKGTISAHVGMMNSVVRTNDRFETGARGIVVGGKLFAQNGVIATQIGTSMGPSTEIYCGVDHSVLRRLEWVRDRNMELATKLNEIRALIKSQGDDSGRLETMKGELQTAVRRLNAASMKLVSYLDKNEEATVSVRDTIYPNTYIEICHVSFVVGRIMRAVTFKLDRTLGKIVSVPLY